MKSKRIACLVLTMMLVAGVIPAQAVELTSPGGTVTTDVTLETNISEPDTPGVPNPEIFSVIVPTRLPIRIDKDGNITTRDNLFIENHSSKDVKVTAVSVEGRNGWSIVTYGDDFSAKERNSKELGLSLRGDTTRAGGQVVLTPENWVVRQEENLDIMASARLGKQSKSDESDIATINWTLDWADKDTKPAIPVSPVMSLTVEYENGLMLPGSSNSATFRWNSTDRNTSLVSVTSASPEIADVSPAAAMAIYRDEKTVEIVANARGTAVFTGTTNTGETASFTVQVSDLDTSKSPSASVEDVDGLKAGDKVSAESVTITIPIINPDGTKDAVRLQPKDIPNMVLDEGENAVIVSADVNGAIIDVPLSVTLAFTNPTNNPSNGFSMTEAEAKAAGFTYAYYGTTTNLEITGFTNVNSKSYIRVPNYIGGNKVVSIGKDAFKNQQSLGKVTIPDSITNIGVRAFAGCTSLQIFKMSNSLTKIGQAAFLSCEKLKDICFYKKIDEVTDSNDYATYVEINGQKYLFTSYNYSPFEGCSDTLNVTLQGGLAGRSGNLCIFRTTLRSGGLDEETAKKFPASYGAITICDAETVQGIIKYYNKITGGTDATTPFSYVAADDIIMQSGKYTSGSLLTHCLTKKITVPSSMQWFNSYTFNDCSNLSEIDYKGTMAQWKTIKIYSSGNEDWLSKVDIHCYDGTIKNGPYSSQYA